MKAKDLLITYNKCLAKDAECYTDQPPDADIGPLDAIFGVLRELFKEIPVIADKRRAKSNLAMISIIKEQKQKFKAVLLLINDPILTIILFDMFLELHYPSIYQDIRNKI